MIGWCGWHKRSMWWRDYPMGWYCPDCMREYRVVTTNSSSKGPPNGKTRAASAG